MYEDIIFSTMSLLFNITRVFVQQIFADFEKDSLGNQWVTKL